VWQGHVRQALVQYIARTAAQVLARLLLCATECCCQPPGATGGVQFGLRLWRTGAVRGSGLGAFRAPTSYIATLQSGVWIKAASWRWWAEPYEVPRLADPGAQGARAARSPGRTVRSAQRNPFRDWPIAACILFVSCCSRSRTRSIPRSEQLGRRERNRRVPNPSARVEGGAPTSRRRPNQLLIGGLPPAAHRMQPPPRSGRCLRARPAAPARCAAGQGQHQALRATAAAQICRAAWITMQITTQQQEERNGAGCAAPRQVCGWLRGSSAEAPKAQVCRPGERSPPAAIHVTVMYRCCSAARRSPRPWLLSWELLGWHPCKSSALGLCSGLQPPLAATQPGTSGSP
jgi:hypothetical protein